MLVRKLDGPYACSASYVEDVLYIVRDRCSVQLAIECETKGVVLKIKPICLGL